MRFTKRRGSLWFNWLLGAGYLLLVACCWLLVAPPTQPTSSSMQSLFDYAQSDISTHVCPFRSARRHPELCEGTPKHQPAP